jgi:hypothetical protein
MVKKAGHYAPDQLRTMILRRLTGATRETKASRTYDAVVLACGYDPQSLDPIPATGVRQIIEVFALRLAELTGAHGNKRNPSKEFGKSLAQLLHDVEPEG